MKTIKLQVLAEMYINPEFKEENFIEFEIDENATEKQIREKAEQEFNKWFESRLFGGYTIQNYFSPSEVGLKEGYVKIEGCDNATGFVRICKEEDLQKVGKEIFAEHPGDDGYYDFNKFLWVSYPDGRKEVRLDSLVEYD
jgi:hypothetical protein